MGRFVTTPRLVGPSKNSTVVTNPLESCAIALSRMLASAKKLAPLVGFTIATVGGTLTGGGGGVLVPTLMLTGNEVPVAPSSSVATAVSEYLPGGTLLQVRQRKV